MKLKFIGAAREVTGSKHLLEINGKKVLLDCGMYQGRRREAAEKNQHFPFDPKQIDVVVLSHAHMDHAGLLPLLTKNGFEGPIYTTFATRDLCEYMLADSAYIQEREAEYLNSKEKRKDLNAPEIEPLYTIEDVEKTMEQFVGVNYHKSFQVTDGVHATFFDAGHILGSAQIYLEIEDREKSTRFAMSFTGDLGRKNLPILRDPEILPPSKYLISECTYGNRFHKSVLNIDEVLEEMINKVAARGGKIIIPAFSLERTQEVVFHLNLLWQQNKIPEMPIYVDSPLSGNITEVFAGHSECFDEQTRREFIDNRINPFGFGRLQYIRDVEESKSLNGQKTPMIIIAASGMCEFGRVLHHLRNNIEDARNMVLIVGYQAENTLGRKLIDKLPVVNIFGKPYRVQAEVQVVDAFSGHADRSDLIFHHSQIKGLEQTFLVHGEESQGLTFCDILKELGYKEVFVPNPLEEFELI
jgi:metallo-beta-lactamase family protein